MASYHTQQKKILTEFLASHSDTPFTIEQLSEELNKNNPESAVPGKSTVYRLMNRLVEDGTVKRFVKGNSRQFLYQIAGGEECHHHLHMKCVSCGRLLHMDDNKTEKLLESVYKNSDFEVDREQTTLFGCCNECRKPTDIKK